MPPPPAADCLERLQAKLATFEALAHLRVRARGALLTVESGPEQAPWPHIRFRRDTVHLWRLEMPVRGGRWERTPYRGPLEDLVDSVVEAFPWTLSD